MSDIKRYGAGEGVGFYWIKERGQWGDDKCILVAIDEVGNLTRTGGRIDFDEAALTASEAVLEHLGGSIKQADNHLERQRRKLADNPPKAKPEPMDQATARFYENGWD